ncbi:MAG TPA: CopG family ribbon-helix-helix protein [Sulfuriferula sp.]|nr:CopG family ribbon-helix-helix protein [Sulfuriferula sp.]
MQSASNRPVSLKLEPSEHERLKTLAELKHRTPHYLMHEAVRQYLEREESRESFKRDALTSWREYQETGLHLTGEEVANWLDSWGTDTSRPVSPCHE